MKVLQTSQNSDLKSLLGISEIYLSFGYERFGTTKGKAC
ncbi:Uncharacterised protein [Sphingobacterium spiritivorum]|uniref:Uncharacterized protein n=1 Tax=Sphingobacterium spiritivorum TaxID=258 RepID=A0A380CP97_SPHSI|nr:Uncharacterised protein [Sphingobacterium spiritivorum]